MRKITEIILHCSATPEGKDYKASDIDKWHKDKGWKCIGYHYVIDIDGTVEIGRPIKDIGAHCTGHNRNSIGICYVGGCDKKMKAKDTRTEEQKESLNNLVLDLMVEYHIPLDKVYCHNQFANNKACPSFSIEDFRKELK